MSTRKVRAALNGYGVIGKPIADAPHQGPDAQTVIPDLDVVTIAVVAAHPTATRIPGVWSWHDLLQGKNAKRMGIKERFATVNNYLRPVLTTASGVKPVSVAFFGGKLELFRLKLWQMIFVLLVIQAQPGDFRNWPVIREWAGNLRTKIE